MAKMMAYAAVALLIGTCVGSGWAMSLLTDEEMALEAGADTCWKDSPQPGGLCHNPGCATSHTFWFPLHINEFCENVGSGSQNCTCNSSAAPCANYYTYANADCTGNYTGPYSAETWVDCYGTDGQCP